MRLATLTDGTKTRVCLQLEERWHPLPDRPDGSLPSVLAALADPAGAHRAAAAADPLPAQGWVATMPYRPARDVFCLGKNYRAHAEEFSAFAGDAEVVPSAPVVFTKAVGALCGPDDDLVVDDDLAGALDYEVELAVVIGRAGYRIEPAAAERHVGAYSVLNDTTARDLQRRHAQWYLGKSLPAATPWGPVLVTPDALDPLGERTITCEIGGERRQYGRLRDMIFPVADAIACISRVTELVPGDLIAMGTPSGVGAGFDPPRYLRDGDLVHCAVEGIGALHNRVRVRAAAGAGVAGDG